MDTTKAAWYVCVGQGVGRASLCRLRSKSGRYVSVSAACAPSVVGVCALKNAWGSLHSPPALERCFGKCGLKNAWGSLRLPPALQRWSVCVRWKTRGARFSRRLRSKGACFHILCVGKCVGLASLAACARRVVGSYVSWLEFPPSY